MADRFRDWAFIVYPDSAPPNWEDVLNEQHLTWSHSPLHEFDVNPDGEVKKAHWHCLLRFEGVKSYSQVCEMIAPLNGPIPTVCNSVRGAVRYFWHLDNPEKFQYNPNEVYVFGGFDIREACKPSASERYKYIAEMEDWVDETHCIHLKDLRKYARTYRFGDWYAVLCDSASYQMGQYILSNYQKLKETFEEVNKIKRSKRKCTIMK